MQAFLFYVIAGLTGTCAIATVVTQNIVRAATWLLFTLAGTSGVFFLLGADLVGTTQLMVYVGGTLVLVVFGVMLTAQGPFINMKTSSAEWAASVTVGLLLLAVLGVSIYTSPGLRETRLRRPELLLPQEEELVKQGTKARQQTLDEAKGEDRKAILQAIAADAKMKVANAVLDKTLIDHAMQKENLDAPREITTGNAPGSTVIGEAFLGVPAGPPHIERPGGKTIVVRATYLLPFEIVSVHLLVVLIGAAYLARAKRRKGASS